MDRGKPTLIIVRITVTEPRAASAGVTLNKSFRGIQGSDSRVQGGESSIPTPVAGTLDSWSKAVLWIGRKKRQNQVQEIAREASRPTAMTP